jgi:hypothetical protein
VYLAQISVVAMRSLPPSRSLAQVGLQYDVHMQHTENMGLDTAI